MSPPDKKPPPLRVGKDGGDVKGCGGSPNGDDHSGEFGEIKEGFAPGDFGIPETAPAVVVIKGPPAIGKTEETFQEAVAELDKQRQKNPRSRSPIIISAPTHKLTGELEPRLRTIADSLPGGLKVARWLGRGALRPGSHETMCRNLDEVRAAQKFAVDIERKICDQTCPFKEGCAYLAQQKVRADFWVIPHAMLFQGAPPPFKKLAIEAVIIDESVDAAALRGTGLDRIEVEFDWLRPGVMPAERLDAKTPAPARAARLAELRRKLGAALWNVQGPVPSAALRAAGLTKRDCLWAERHEHYRIYRGDEPALLRHNASVAPMETLWRGAAHLLDKGFELSGRLEVVRESKPARRFIRVRDFASIHKDYQRPTVLLDATFDLERSRHLFSNPVVTEIHPIDQPHVRVWQGINRSAGKSMLIPLPEREKETDQQRRKREAENKKRGNNRGKLRVHLINLSRRAERMLVITYKSLIDLLDLPPGIATANFNALAGRDEFKDFDLLVIIGRPLPPPDAVEEIAGTIIGGEPKRTQPPEGGGRRWYDKRQTQRWLRQGDKVVAVPAMVDCHPDLLAEAYLRRICQGEIVQAAGRLRGIRRGEGNPATIIIVNDVVLEDFVVDELFDAGDFFRTSPQDEMMAAGGIIFENAADAFRAYPTLWPSQDATARALHRASADKGGVGHFAIRKPPSSEIPCSPNVLSSSFYIGKCPTPPFTRVTYQRAGTGTKTTACWMDLTFVKDPKGALETLIGPIRLCLVISNPIPKPPTAHFDAEGSTGVFKVKAAPLAW